MKLLNSTACAVCAALMALAPAYAAQDAGQLTYEEDGKQIFLPEYFDRYAPQTARDMIFNVPGFQVRSADQKRGLGQGGTNVLINGSRVSGKSTDPLDVLSRTSREAVVRIEILDGATLGISGLSGPVANVVLNTTKTTGNFEWRPQFRKGLATRWSNGSVSVSGTAKGVSYTLGFENDAFRNGAWGPELVTGPNGEILETRYDDVQPYGENPEVTLSLGHKDAAGREANFNASFALFDFEFSEISRRSPTDPMIPDSYRVIDDYEDEWNTEISGDYAFDAFGGRMKLIGFQYLEHSPFKSEGRLNDENGFVYSERFERTVDEGESILRIEQNWPMGEGKSFELGAEAVYNFNEAESAFFDIAEDGTEMEFDVPGGNTKIEERRGEISGTYNFPLGKKLDIQASLAMEYSELEQTGDNGNKRSFTRPKGFVSATYDWSENVELRARVDRRVGQLDFFAFASSVDLQDGNDRAGNTDLSPQQSWFYEAAIEKTFKDESQVTLSFQYEDIEDIVQRIPIAVTDPMTMDTVMSEGFGNVPEATRWRVELQGTQMLENLGVKGGQFDYRVFYRESEIADPFSGALRRLNDETKWFYRFEYRHDIPDTDYAWGMSIEDFENSEAFFGTQVSLYDQSAPTWEIYAEHKDFFGMNAQIYVFNILNYTEDFRRDVYDGQRPDGEFLFREAREFAFNPIVGLNFSKTF
ncbi:TonB-dependent receptor plug domain-containing protein [Parvularcula marina]|uniref:TonB-dependent receptor plug domain-containing protein n=2 Tax=Parvularcula marina TaxID=2292771 RepID=UPI003516CE2C